MADLGSIFEEAVRQYPILGRSGIKAVTGAPNGSNMLEYWPPGEPGDAQRPRPPGIPLGSAGVELYSDKVRPLDVLGDVVSHQLVNTDPKIGDYFAKFTGSLSNEQRGRLQEQYRYAQQNEGETRPYAEWEKAVGMPAYFRGYPFQQWPAEFNEKAYSPEQRNLLDGMMQYLRK
jgi:hypothetical protein